MIQYNKLPCIFGNGAFCFAMKKENLMKKLCALLLAVLLLCSVGCGKQPAAEKNDDTENQYRDTEYTGGSEDTDNATGGVSAAEPGTFSIGGTKLDSVLVYAGEYGTELAEELAKIIADGLSVSAEKTENALDANILFAAEHELIDSGSWGIVCSDGKLFAAVGNEYEAELAVGKLRELVESSGGGLALDGVVYTETHLTDEELEQMRQLVIYPEFPEQIRRIYDYDVYVTLGKRTEKLPVYNHTVESNVSRRPGADMYRRFAAFAFGEGEVRVDIKVKTDFASYTVFPSAKNLRHSFNEKTGIISVYLDTPEYFGIQLDDDQNSIISIMADPLENEEDIPDRNAPNVMYIDGWYETENGLLDITEPNTILYIAPGSVLNARVTVKADNCKVLGRGAIVDPFENIYEYDIRTGGTEGAGRKMLIISGSNCIADGVFMLDARCFNLLVDGKNNIARNIKVFSSMMTTDGITATGENVLNERSWYYCGDNGIVFSARKSTFRDIAIGTTCAALFPQGSPTDDLFEDIYVFRADDGILTNAYNGSNPGKTHRTESVTIRRLSAMEVPNSSVHFFLGANMGNLSKLFNFEQISMPEMTKTAYYRNGTRYLYTENYYLNFLDYAENGEIITDISQAIVKYEEDAENYETFAATGTFKPVKRNVEIVDYTAPDKVFIGVRQVFFETAPVYENDTLMLPKTEICSLLRMKEIGDKDFVSADELIEAGLVESASVTHGDLYLVPAYNGRNLFLEDEGEISYFSEHSCYQLELVTSEDRDGIIYTVYSNPKSPSTTAGIARQITNEVRMYGTGTYQVSFSARACENGSLKMILQKDGTNDYVVFGAGEEWKNYSFTIYIDDNAVSAVKCMLCFTGEGTVINEFSFRDFSLTKVK